jgi:23S rRNA (adenine2503-C2)-methyltransferase
MEKKSFFDRQGRNLFVKEQKIQPFRIKQIDHEIFKNGVINFEEMTTISKDMRSLMAENFQIIDYDNIEIQENPNTTKFLITLRGGGLIEAVLMHHYHVDKETKIKKINRFTLCISCQV